MNIKQDSLSNFFLGAFVTSLIILGLRTTLISLGSAMQDFTYYRSATQNLLSGLDPYFTYPTQVYPPASLLLFIPFSLMPTQVANTLWLAASLISLFIGIHLFLSHITKKPRFTFSFIIFLLALQTFPVKYALAQGQINFLVFVLFALLFHFLSVKKYSLAGLVLSLAVILKFNPVFLLLYLFAIKKTKPLLVFFLSLITLNLFIDLIFPPHLNTSFLQTITNMSTHYAGYYYNTSIAALTIRWFDQSFAGIVNPIISASIWLITLLSVRNVKNNLLTFSLFIVAILLTSPITWQHYLFWSLPAFLLLFKVQTRNVNTSSSAAFRTCMLHPGGGSALSLFRRILIKSGFARMLDNCTFRNTLSEEKKIATDISSEKKHRGTSLWVGVRPASTFITFISFILINYNIKDPQVFSVQNPLYSHATFGLFLLWLLLVRKHEGIRRLPR